MKFKNISQKISTLLLATVLGLGVSGTALASSIHKTYVLRDNLTAPGVPAQNNFPFKIYLAPGYGVTLNFSGLGESLESVWLDNPSFTTLDTNRQADASVVHLRRIKPVNIDGIIKTATTGMTVVTKTAEGRNKVYLFQVIPVNHPSTLLIDFYRPERKEINACGSFGIEAEIAKKKNEILVSRLKGNMSLAYADGFLKVASPLNSRLNELISYLSCGMPLPEATIKSGVTNQLVDSLLALDREKIRKLENQHSSKENNNDR